MTASLGALDGPLPPKDAFEANDGADPRGYRLYGRWSKRVVRATLDFWDDQDDVYPVYLRAGERLDVSLDGPDGANPSLVLWRPGVGSLSSVGEVRKRLAFSARPGSREHIGARAGADGWYSIQVRLGAEGAGPYRLTAVRSR